MRKDLKVLIILSSRMIRKSEKSLKDLIWTRTDLSQKVSFNVTGPD